MPRCYRLVWGHETKRRIVAGIVTALALTCLPATARAATFAATATPDAPDANPGDGVCDDGSGNCPIRAAVMEANALAGADTINLGAGTFPLATAITTDDEADGDLDVTEELTLAGAGMNQTTIEQTVGDRVLDADLPTNHSIAITALEVTGGDVDGDGGGLRVDGNLADAQLEGVRVTGNQATGNGARAGGGIYRIGGGSNLTLVDSVVEGNLAANLDALSTETARGGGVHMASFGDSALSISASTIENNEVAAANPAVVFHSGGGLNASNGTALVLEDSLLEDNEAGSGGGLAVGLFSASEITATTFAGNAATAGAGGAMLASGSGAPLDVSNSTFTSSTSVQQGRAVYMTASPTVNLDSATFAENPLNLTSPLIQANAPATVNLRRTILDDEHPCGSNPTFASQGDNLFSHADSECPAAAPMGDIVDPGTGVLGLADNGGPTPTMGLTPTSPALDEVAFEACPPPATDQRGYARGGPGTGPACDIGAVERTNMRLAVKAPKRVRVRRKIRVKVGCNTDCSLRTKVRIRLKRSGAGGFKTFAAKPKHRDLDLSAGQRQRLTFRLSRRQVRRIGAELARKQTRKRSRALFIARGSAVDGQTTKRTVRRRLRA